MGTAGCPSRDPNSRRWLAHPPKSKVRPGIFYFENGIGAATTAARPVDGIKVAVDRAMAEVHLELGGATTALVTEIKQDSSATTRELQAQAMAVRARFGIVIGNQPD